MKSELCSGKGSGITTLISKTATVDAHLKTKTQDSPISDTQCFVFMYVCVSVREGERERL